MWFNITMENHSKGTAVSQMAPLLRTIRNTLGACGHEVTIVPDQVYPAAINLCFENFSRTHAKQFGTLRRQHGLRFGVIATELMIGGTIPYADKGINIVGVNEKDKDAFIRLRMANFHEVIKEVDFLWCLLPRTAEEYRERCAYTEFLPTAWSRDIQIAERRSPKDIDVFFFGRATPHRKAVFERLASTNLQVVFAGAGWPMGWLPDFMIESLLDRSKVALNLTLHAVHESPDGNDPRFVSCLRVTEMLERRACILSEDIPFDNPYAQFMNSCPVEQIAERCNELVLGGHWKRLGEDAADRFRNNMNVRDICGPVIERTLDAISVRGGHMARGS